MTEKNPVLPYRFAKRHQVLLVAPQENETYWQLRHTKQLTAATLAECYRYAQAPIQTQCLSTDGFAHELEQYYHQQADSSLPDADIVLDDAALFDLAQQLPKPEDLLASEDDAPIIRLINALFTQALKQQASDIHIETYEDELSIRLRIDGILQPLLQPQRQLAPLIISRIKVMAKLDIAEKRLPQDGRLSLNLAGRLVDVRVSTLPASHGERIVLRLLDQKNAQLNLSHLGMQTDTLTQLKHLIAQPHGILLITGPTGAGKTTSLYAILSALNQPSRNILTVEDPIEYDLPGIGQTQVNKKVDMTFAKGLRAMLRQDPDVVMVGEIRDLETAEIAVQASLTGHLVLSTLHTNTAVGAITRLHDMGVAPFLLASSLIGIVAQRLVRLLCPHCKQAYTASAAECQQLGCNHSTPPTLYRASGCDQCHHSGYRGRQGIYELIEMNESLREKIHRGESEQQLKHYATTHCRSIRQDGIDCVLAGKVPLAEVLRVTSEVV